MTDYTLAELVQATGLSPRTIRYYITQGLIQAPGREGRSTRYPEPTLARLRLIVELRDRNLSLAQIRAQLADMSDSEAEMLAGQRLDESRTRYLDRDIRALAAAPRTLHRLDLAASGDEVLAFRAARDEPRRLQLSLGEDLRNDEARSQRFATGVGERSQWEHIRITGDIELHVRRPLSRRDNRIVDRLMALARELADEHPP